MEYDFKENGWKTILVLYKGKINEWCKLPTFHNMATIERDRLMKAGYLAHIAAYDTDISKWIIRNEEFVYNE